MARTTSAILSGPSPTSQARNVQRLGPRMARRQDRSGAEELTSFVRRVTRAAPGRRPHAGRREDPTGKQIVVGLGETSTTNFHRRDDRCAHQLAGASTNAPYTRMRDNAQLPSSPRLASRSR